MSVVVVTGAANGIGRATVDRLLAAGRTVVAVDLDAASLNELPYEVAQVVGDVSHRSTHEQAARVALTLGTLTGWVNNAGIQIDSPVTQLEEATVRRQVDVNLLGTLWGCSVALEHMRDGASIVSVSSIHALRGFPFASVYAATKGAIVSLTRQLAVEHGARGIRLNAVLPGAVRTAMTSEDWQRAADPAAARAEDEAMHLANRLGEPTEVAEVIGFLLSDAASLMNGQEIVVDGGATARRPRGGQTP